MRQRRILLVQLADIGDLVLATPALAALRDALPDAHLTLLAASHTAPIVPPGLVDEVKMLDKASFNGTLAFFRPANLRRVFALRHGRYEAVLFFHHFTLKPGTLKFWLIAKASRARQIIGLDNGNGWFLTQRLPDGGFGAKHQARYWLDLVALLGASATDQPAQVRAQADPAIMALLESTAGGPLVMLHPGSGGYSLARRWDAAGFAAVADALHRERGARVVLVGGNGDGADAVRQAMTHAPIDLSGRTRSLASLAAVLRQADLFIGADSGVMHLASAVGVPVVAVFGPSNPDAWGPWTPQSPAAVVRSSVLCSPCSYVGHGIGLREGCAARTCMRLVTPERVLAAAHALLDGLPAASPPPTPQTRHEPRRWILGLPVDPITYEDWLAHIADWVAQRGPARQVCTVNPEFMMIARKDANFRHILRRAALCVPDGVGLLWAAKRLGDALPERVTGSDGVPIIAERAAKAGWTLYLLGAAPGVAEAARDVLVQRHPTLHVVGTYSGSPAAQEEDAIVQRINASGADLLFVAYGAPAQDKWIARNLPRLNVAMAMGVGGSLDFIAGRVPRAPSWMRRLGLEWLFRLVRQPWRWRRMLRLPAFVLAVLREGEGDRTR